MLCGGWGEVVRKCEKLFQLRCVTSCYVYNMEFIDLYQGDYLEYLYVHFLSSLDMLYNGCHAVLYGAYISFSLFMSR